jgi:hypothetical protein
MNSVKNVTLEWVRRHVGPTCRRLMRRTPASRLGPLLVWVEFVHEISPMWPEWQQILMAREIVPQTVPPLLPVWTVPKLYSQACLVNWNYLHTSFSSQMIRFLVRNMWHLTLFAHPFFCLSSFFCYFLSFCFLFARKCFMWQILSSMQKTQQQGMYTCKILKLHHLKGIISENIWIHQKFLVGGSFTPHRLFNLCKALCECFYIRVLLGSSECF